MAARHIGWVRSLSASPAQSANAHSVKRRPPRPARRLAGRLALTALPALSAALVGVLAPPASPNVAFAQAGDAPPEVEKSNFRVEGQVTKGGYLLAGPSESFYPTQYLKPGAVVTVVGKKGSWLAVEPPEGSFSFVSKQFIHRYGDGSHGRVVKPNPEAAAAVIVRAGSDAQPGSQWATQARLEVGQDVAILGEENQYFRIKPPEGAHLFIAANAVVPLPKKSDTDSAGGVAQGTPGTPGVTPGTAVGGGTASTPGDVTHRAGPETAGDSSGAGTTAPGTGDGHRPPTRPAGTPHDVASDTGHPAPGGATPGEGPSTRPVLSESLARLQKLEGEFTAASNQPLTDQPIEALLTGYEELAGAPGVPEPTRKMADARARTLKVRAQVRDEFAAVQQKQPEQQRQIDARIAEQEELQASIKKLDVHVYLAVGTLRPSSLQVGNGGGATTLYRLTDPATGRGLLYLRTSDPKYADLIGRFVGVKGKVGTESQLSLKVVNPTDIEVVDPSKVNHNIAAQIIPPSLLPRTPAAPTTPTASSGQ